MEEFSRREARSELAVVVPGCHLLIWIVDLELRSGLLLILFGPYMPETKQDLPAQCVALEGGQDRLRVPLGGRGGTKKNVDSLKAGLCFLHCWIPDS